MVCRAEVEKTYLLGKERKCCYVSCSFEIGGQRGSSKEGGMSNDFSW